MNPVRSGVSPHSRTMAGAANEIARMSKPSMVLISTHSATTAICWALMGRSAIDNLAVVVTVFSLPLKVPSPVATRTGLGS